jgi:hypothetical protein
MLLISSSVQRLVENKVKGLTSYPVLLELSNHISSTLVEIIGGTWEIECHPWYIYTGKTGALFSDFTRRGNEFLGIILKSGIFCYFWLYRVEIIAACFWLYRLGFKDGSVSCFKDVAELEGCVCICRRTISRRNLKLWIKVKFSFKLETSVNETRAMLSAAYGTRFQTWKCF